MNPNEFKVKEVQKLEDNQNMISLVNLNDDEIFKTPEDTFREHHHHYMSVEGLILRKGTDTHDFILSYKNMNELIIHTNILSRKIDRLEHELDILKNKRSSRNKRKSSSRSRSSKKQRT